MSADKKWRLICYDVCDPKRYRELYKVIRGVGRRVQYSVFRARLDDREVEQLRWTLAKILDPVDRLLVVDLCPTCASRVISRNHVDGWTAQQPACTVIVKQASPAVALHLDTVAPTGVESPMENGLDGAGRS